MRRKLCHTLSLWVAVMVLWAPAAWTQSAPDEAPILVGRISYVEGELLRWIAQKENWVATAVDSPFGREDTLYATEKAKAELVLPNNTWVRIGGDTQIQLVNVSDELSELDVVSGVARFMNRANGVEVKVTTPFGYVMAPAQTAFDLYVDDKSMEVIAVNGTVDFVREGGGERFEVIAGSSSVLVDKTKVAVAEGVIDVAWDRWNQQRDSLWASRWQVEGQSAKYLPARLRSESYVFEKYGRWEQVSVDGEARTLWRPTGVATGWAPYTQGRWIVWNDDNCWLPAEPFGYVTHHYGSWVTVGSQWYWAPPVATVSVATPAFGVGFAWYPGRVAWIHSEAHVGWVPLAPGEVYYAHHHWGPDAVVVHSGLNIDVDLHQYHYASHAVIVRQSSLYTVANYSRVRVRAAGGNAFFSSYHVAPVVSSAVFRGYDEGSARFGFTKVKAKFRPHGYAVERIHYNHGMVREHGNFRVKEMRQEMVKIKHGQFVEGADIAYPKYRHKMMVKENIHVKSGNFGHGGYKEHGKVKGGFEHVNYHENYHVNYHENFHESKGRGGRHVDFEGGHGGGKHGGEKHGKGNKHW